MLRGAGILPAESQREGSMTEAAVVRQQEGGERTRLIVDCDPGVDDAQALLMALAHSDRVDLIAVTTVMGNSLLDNTTRNALRILQWAGRTDIPVYRGAECSLVGVPTPNDAFHGYDGLGDVTLEGVDPVDVGTVVQTEPAASALCRLVTQHPGSITLLAIGPLTNVATALSLDSQFGAKLKQCVIMGGNVNGRGNITPAAEFNFYSDPEAAQCVLSCLAPCAVTLLPMDTCELYSFSWDWYNAIMAHSNRTAVMLRSIDACMVGRMRDTGAPKYWAWDQLAMAIVLRPDAVLASRMASAAVELRGEMTRGQMVLGARGKGPGGQDAPPSNVRIIDAIDQDIYEALFLHTVQYDFSKKLQKV